MKKILLSASLLLASMATFAQMPDASNWTKGEEITDQIGWGNLSFEEPASDGQFDSWTLESSKGSFTKTGGLFEVYDGADVDLYQVIQLPAGMYRVECQGYYRCGNSWDDDPNSFGNPDKWADNALLYVQNGTYDIDNEAFTPARTFKTPLMPRLFLAYPEQIYVDEVKEGWDMSDGDYGTKGWGPCSVPGSLAWFNAGLYQPYVDEDYDETKIKYNTTTFWLKEDGYVKVGVSKMEPRSADSFMATNFKMYYEGEVDAEMAELMALQEEVQEYYDQLMKIRSNYSEGMIYSLIDDAIQDFEDDYGTPDELEADQCAPAKEYLQDLIAKVLGAETAYNNLIAVLPKIELLYNTTDYAGKAEFEAYVKAAQNCLDPDYEMSADDNFDSFKKAYDNLIAARVTYLMTQEKVNGAYNFSSAIDMPFFCQNEYTPVWNEEANAYQFPTIEGVEDDLQPENTWATIQEQGYTEARDAEGREAWIHICEGVTPLSEKAVENQWCIKSTTWHGGGPAGVTMQHSYPAIGGWTAEPTGNPELVYQTLTGLPDGYYSMSALMCNAGADISDLQFAYIETTDGTKETAPLTKKGSPWWGGNREAWRDGVWEKLSTAMVYVGDGKVTIGVSSDAFYATTGFQLYYYGATPDFASLLKPMVEKAQANINDNLVWAGDIAKANALLASIVLENITDGEGYQAAQATIAEVNQYVATASAAVNNWKGIENFTALAGKYADGTPENEIVNTAMMESLMIGEGENDTYELAVQNNKDYTAYVTYLDFRAAMGELIDAPAVAAVVAEQNKSLTEKMANDKELAEMQAALALPYNKALLASLGTADASETNPVDITALLVNPKFDEGNKGWTGNPTLTSDQAIEAELGAAEMWNCNFDVYQTIYSLPAGCYKVECQALYRDAGDATAAYNNWWYGAGADMEFWENQNAKLYANKQETIIGSIASEPFTDRSMTAFRDKWIKSEEADEDGNDVWVEHWKAMSLDAIDLPEGLAEEQIEINTDGWFWDTEIDDVDELYYYPASLMGISHRLTKNPEAYKTEVLSMVEEGGSLRLGIKKETLISGDWVVFDNFKLYYLGTEIPTGIDEAAAAKAQVAGVFSLSGAQQQGLQKGINIVKMSDGTVRKVLVK